MYLSPSAPPSYAEVVTEEQRRNNLAPVSACDDFERALQGPLFAYIQEFRFLPPPLYSEVSAKTRACAESPRNPHVGLNKIQAVTGQGLLGYPGRTKM